LRQSRRQAEQQEIPSRERWGCCFHGRGVSQSSRGLVEPTARIAVAVSGTARCLRIRPRKDHRGAKQISWVGPLAPFNGRLVEPKCLDHERARFVEVLWRCAGPVSCGASGGVAIAAQRNPFFTSQHVADTDRFLGVRWIDGATLIEAPCPGSAARTLKDFLTLLELFERKRGVHRANAIGIGAGLDRFARRRGHARTLFHSAEANRFSWVIRLRYAQSGCTKRILMFA